MDPRAPEPEAGRQGPIARAAGGVVGFFDSVSKVVGAIAGVLALLGALGLITLTGGDKSTSPEPTPTPTPEPSDVQVDKSETRASASVPSLPRQDDPTDANDYEPDNMLDGQLRTAWVEGVPGLGSGTRLTFRLPTRVRVTRVRIVNGYAKTTKTHLENAAARTILIRTAGMSKPLRHTLARDSRPQTIRGAFGMTRRVTIQIVSAYPGDRFEDLALSEVWFFARRS
jgi:hypothetical protein